MKNIDFSIVMKVLTIIVIVFGISAISSAIFLMRYDMVFSVIVMYATVGIAHIAGIEKYLSSDESTDLEQRMMRLMPFNWKLFLVLFWPYIWLR